MSIFLFFYPAKQITDKAKAIATIFNKSKRRVEGTISKEGYFERSVKSENLSGRIFVQNWESENPIVYCGVQNGFCINCGRELIDPRSLQAGYGKECASELGIPYFS